MVSCSSTPATRATTGWKASSAVLASRRGKPRRNEVGASMSTGRHLADSLALKIALVAVWLRCDPETDRRYRRECRCRIGPALSRSGDESTSAGRARESSSPEACFSVGKIPRSHTTHGDGTSSERAQTGERGARPDGLEARDGTRLAVGAITAAIGDVVFGRPRGAHRSQIVGSAAAKKSEDPDYAKNRSTADNPNKRAGMHGTRSIAHLRPAGYQVEQ